jgi:hypothetical protein
MQSPSETVQDGSRVRIEGLQARPELNGRTGVVYGAFNQESGRWAIHVDANDASPATQISVRPANLKILPAVASTDNECRAAVGLGVMMIKSVTRLMAVCV